MSETVGALIVGTVIFWVPFGAVVYGASHVVSPYRTVYGQAHPMDALSDYYMFMLQWPKLLLWPKGYVKTPKVGESMPYHWKTCYNHP